jgi:hypothetical protein
MTIPDSVKLIAIMAGFLLYDSALLLYVNEALLSLKKGKWRIHFGSTHFTIAGKCVFISNPFALHRPLYRLAWHDANAASRPTEDLAAIDHGLSKLAPLVGLSAVAQFVLLPTILFWGFTLPNLIFAAILIYTANILLITAVFWNRAQFELTRKQIISLAIEYLLCPPISLNIIRRLSLARSFKDDLSVVARSLLTHEDWKKARLMMEIEIDQEIESPGSTDRQ